MTGYADALIEGRIFRGLREGFAEALAIAGGRVVACGSRGAVRALAGSGTRRVELDGRVAVPAFNDAHQHLLPLGLAMTQVNLRPERVRTLDALLAAIRDAATRTPRGQWVQGRGYDHAELDIGRHPTAAELTAAAPDHPVFVVRACGHMGVANAAGLAAAGVGHNTPDPEGGVIGRAAGGLTGLLQERAMRLVRAAIPEPDDAALVDAIERAGTHMNGLGFTAVMDASVGMVAGMREVAAYRAAHAAGRLPVRTWICLAGNPEGIAEQAWQAGIRPGDGDAMLRFGAVKVFADGSAGGLTAAMSEPYLPGGAGVLCFPDATMRALLARYHAQGWQLAIHAIGDAAINRCWPGWRPPTTKPNLPPAAATGSSIAASCRRASAPAWRRAGSSRCRSRSSCASSATPTSPTSARPAPPRPTRCGAGCGTGRAPPQARTRRCPRPACSRTRCACWTARRSTRRGG